VYYIHSLESKELACSYPSYLNCQTNFFYTTLCNRLKVQIDVIRQLGTKIETNLKELEQKLQSMPRAEAAVNRATHIKLTRDYHWVETKYKNVQLEAKQSMHRKESQLRLQAEEIGRRQEGREAENHRLQMQMELQDDRVTEEIMKEREEEVRKINHGMHQVNEIYKVRLCVEGGCYYNTRVL
jgi:hypothetical protein